MTPLQLLDLCKNAVKAWIDDFAPSMGAAISYYTMFSIAPMLVIVIAIAGAVFGREAVQGEIVGQLQDLIGRDGAIAVQGLIKSASDTDKGLVAGLVSLGLLLVGATTVFAELQSALDRIWHVPASAKPSGILATLRARLLSFGLILGLAFLLMVSLVTSAVITAFSKWTGDLLPGQALLLQGVNVVLSMALSTLLFAMIFKFMTNAKLRWHDVWIGAGVTALLFEVGKYGIGLYLGRSGVNASFAAAGALVVLLAWVYYAAQIFLLGAEFTKVYASEHGSAAGTRAVVAGAKAAEAAEIGTDDPLLVAQSHVGRPPDDGATRGGSGEVRAVPTTTAVGVSESPGLVHVAAAQKAIDQRLQRAAKQFLRSLALLAVTVLASEFAQRRTRHLRKSAQSSKNARVSKSRARLRGSRSNQA